MDVSVSQVYQRCLLDDYDNVNDNDDAVPLNHNAV